MATNMRGDSKYMEEAIKQKASSKDPHFKVGACLVDNNTGKIIGRGANNMPRNLETFPWEKIKKKDKEGEKALKDKHLYVCHAELNAIAMAITTGKSIADCKLYCTLHPCNECAKVIVQLGIKEVIYLSNEKGLKVKFRASEIIFEKTKVVCRKLLDSTPSDEKHIGGATIMPQSSQTEGRPKRSRDNVEAPTEQNEEREKKAKNDSTNKN